MFTCGYCGKEYKTLVERCQCETKCGKKQEEEAYYKKQKELIRIKKDRDEEITNAARCLANQIDTFHSDYNEKCGIECLMGSDSTYENIWIMNLLRYLSISQ